MEVESALVSHPNVAEAAAVGIEHEIKGQGVVAFVTPTGDSEPTPELKTNYEFTSVQVLALSPNPSRSALPRRFPRPEAARSCGASSGTSLRARNRRRHDDA